MQTILSGTRRVSDLQQVGLLPAGTVYFAQSLTFRDLPAYNRHLRADSGEPIEDYYLPSGPSGTRNDRRPQRLALRVRRHSPVINRNGE